MQHPVPFQFDANTTFLPETSDLIPTSELPFAGAEAIRRPQDDSSTCLIWETYDATQANRHLIIKQLRPELYSDKRLHDCFVKEYNIGQKIMSTYFPRYVSLYDDGAKISLTTEYIEGDTLDKVLNENPQYFKVRGNLRRFIFQMLEALDDLHSAGVLHLDLKPRNIIITHRTDNVRIIDLGYSYADDWQVSMGRTMPFASPEQKRGDLAAICSASDIYSFGCIVQYISRVSRCRVPRYVKHIIRKCTEEDISKRYGNVRQIFDDLDIGAQQSAKRTAIVSAVTATVVICILAAGYSFYRFWYDKEFEYEGFIYSVYYDDHFYRDALQLKSPVAGAYNDTCLVLPNQITHHGRTYAVRAIGDSCFMRCKSLKSVVFCDSLTSVHPFAFYGCSSLQYVSAQRNLSYVGKAAFAVCDSLKGIDIDEHNPYLYMRDNILFSYTGPYLLQCMSSVSGDYVIPDGIRIIYDYAFYGCKHLTSITYPNSVSRINPNAMEGCTSLTSVEFPQYVVDIENNVLAECSSLSSVTLPENAVIIGWFAFKNCKALETITIPATIKRLTGCCFCLCTNLKTVVNLNPVPQEINDGVFACYGDLYVPQESVDAYKAAPNWNKFTIHPIQD